MEPASLTHSPFAVLTFIVAPALLTNSSSVLALSTINRMLRTRGRMHELFAKFDAGGLAESEAVRLIEQVNRVEKQIREEAALIRERHSQRMTRLTDRAGSDPGAKTWSLNHERTRHSQCFFNGARLSATGWRSAERTRQWLARAKHPTRGGQE